MSTTTRKGKMHRPSYLYKSGFEELEMMESCRNVMEQVREELKRMNWTLKRISRNTAKPRRKRELASGAAGA